MGLFDFIRRLFGGGSDDAEEVAGGTAWAAGSGASEERVDDEKFQGIAEMHDEMAAADERVDVTEAAEVESTTSKSDAADRVGEEDEDLEPPASFRQEAEELAEFWPEHDLDFSTESLSRLDRFVDDQWDKDRFDGIESGGEGVHLDELAFRGIVTQLGAYFGETLVRTYDEAEWADEAEFGWVVSVDGPDGSLFSNVFHVATDCLREPSKFAVSHDNVVRYAGLDGELLVAEDGDHVTIAVSTPDEDTDPERFREAAERLVDDYSWEALDYTPESLSDLDRIVDEEIFDGETLVDDFEEEELSELVRKLGSYLGETLVESHDGEWVYEDGAWTVDVHRGGEVIGVEVFQAALSALHQGVDFAALYEQLAGGAPGSEASAALGETEGEESIAEMAAAQAQVFAGQYPAYDLDFSRDSLDRLDQLAADEYGALDGVAEPTQELLEIATPFSAYFGEVMRREYGAAWTDDDGPAIYLETGDGGNVGVDAIQAAATCLAGNGTFEGTCETLLAQAEP